MLFFFDVTFKADDKKIKGNIFNMKVHKTKIILVRPQIKQKSISEKLSSWSACNSHETNQVDFQLDHFKGF